MNNNEEIVLQDKISELHKKLYSDAIEDMSIIERIILEKELNLARFEMAFMHYMSLKEQNEESLENIKILEKKIETMNIKEKIYSGMLNDQVLLTQKLRDVIRETCNEDLVINRLKEVCKKDTHFSEEQIDMLYYNELYSPDK